MKDGIAWRMDFMRTSRPAWDKSFSFHPWILWQTLSLVVLKFCFFACPTKKGRPKYFSNWEVIGAPNKSAILLLVCWSVFMLKNSCVLLQFICYLETCSYVARMSKIVWHSLSFAWQKSKLSSTKNRSDTFGPSLHKDTPWSLPLFSTCCIKAWKPSFFYFWGDVRSQRQ